MWADVPRWADWNGDIEQVELVGSFAAGSRIVMTPIGQEPIELRIAEAAAPQLFVDEADLGDVIVRTTHRVERIENERSEINYRMEITGPQADTLGPQIGPGISADFPQTLASLVSTPRAEGCGDDPKRRSASAEREPRVPALARDAALAA